MADRCTLAVDVWMPIQGQGMYVYAGSVVDVVSSSMFRPNQVSNVQAGSGVLLNGTYHQPGVGGPFKAR
jgi:hypothetical protein